MSAFFTLHRELPREGPGEAADVGWAADLAGVGRDAAICDMACGPGADIEALLQAAPDGFVTAIDKMAHFVDAARDRFKGHPQVKVVQGDMATIDGQFDLIWCAGALYFLGLQRGLRLWRKNLRKGGVIAFTQPCFFTSSPSEAAVAFWDGDEVMGKPVMATQIGLAGYELLGARQVSDAGWAAYYDPMLRRIDALWDAADADLRAVLTASRQEAADWRKVRSETGYLLCVVRPI